MDRTVLVSFDIEAGQEIVNALDNNGRRPNVAMWARLEEYGDSRLILASERFDDASLRANDIKVFDTLTHAGVDVADTYAVLVFRMSDVFISELRKRYSQRAKISKPRRLSDQSFGGKYVEEAYIYRIE